MVKFIFKCAIKYVSLFALFLATFIAINSLAAIVFGLLSGTGFQDWFGSGLVIFSMITTIAFAVTASQEYVSKKENRYV
jgi:hypothetical protein